MNCKYHAQIKGVNTCSVCGDWLCKECFIDIDNRNYCKDCLKEDFENNKYLQKIENSQSEAKIEKYNLKIKNINLKDVIFYGINLIPGCGQMYLGKSIRGITSLLLISYSIYLGNTFLWEINSQLISLAISLYFYSFFDALVLKRQIKNNNYELYSNIDKNPNFLLNLCFSLIPGCGQMYLGYTYYGTILNIIFFMSIFSFEFTIPLGIVVYLFSFFNAMNLRKQILNGVYFDDSPKSILKIIKSTFSNNIKKETIIDKRIKKSQNEN